MVESDSPRGPHEHSQWWDPATFHAHARGAAEVTKGERAGEDLPTPPPPQVSARRENDRAVISYAVPAAAEGQPRPERIVLTVDAEDDGLPPATYRADLDRGAREVEHPLPLAERSYRVRASTVSADGRASETVEAPLASSA